MKRYTGRVSVLYAFIRAVSGDAGGPKASIIYEDDSVRLASMLNTADLRLSRIKTPAKVLMSDENVNVWRVRNYIYLHMRSEEKHVACKLALFTNHRLWCVRLLASWLTGAQQKTKQLWPH